MIRHIVMFKFKDSANGRSKEENLQEAKARMLALGEEIPEFTRFTVSFGAGGQAPGNYDYILVSEFDSLDPLPFLRSSSLPRIGQYAQWSCC